VPVVSPVFPLFGLPPYTPFPFPPSFFALWILYGGRPSGEDCWLLLIGDPRPAKGSQVTLRRRQREGGASYSPPSLLGASSPAILQARNFPVISSAVFCVKFLSIFPVIRRYLPMAFYRLAWAGSPRPLPGASWLSRLSAGVAWSEKRYYYRVYSDPVSIPPTHHYCCGAGPQKRREGTLRGASPLFYARLLSLYSPFLASGT
jgi:hypothetical protein